MTTAIRLLGFLALGAGVLAASGCKLVCKESETKNGSECTAKSETRFVGTAVPKSVVYQSGNNVSVEGQYGNITVQQGTSTDLQVTFKPFDYEGYDEKDIATQNMNDHLVLDVQPGGTIIVTAARTGQTTTGLGADIVVSLPTAFNGTLNLHNKGEGPLAGNNHEFDVNVQYTGQGAVVVVNDEAALGDCTVVGAALVTATTVTCHKVVNVSGVSDNVSISTEGAGMDDPSVVLSIAAISAGATGGNITVSDSGSINATFPSAANFAVQASAPKGAINPGTIPSACNNQAPSATAETITCGTGSAIYKLTTNGENNNVFNEGNINISLQ